MRQPHAIDGTKYPPALLARRGAGHRAEARYGIRPAAIQELPAELDRNFLLRAQAGEAYVLKIAHSSVSESVLDLQNKTLRHLGARLDSIPELIAARDGSDIVEVSAADGGSYRARLLRYIEGVPLSDFRPHGDELLADIGAQLGRLSAAMQCFNHAEKRLAYRWNIGNLSAVARYGRDLPPDKKALLDHFRRLVRSASAADAERLAGLAPQFHLQ